MNLNDVKLPDVEALVRFGRLGFQMIASRMLSLTSLFGSVALGAYVAYSPSWQGAAIVAAVLLFAFGPALKAESRPPEK